MLRKILLMMPVMLILLHTGCSDSGSSDGSGSGKIYYVDSSGGNDSNDGLSEAGAWKTIDKVNSRSYLPGDTILFKRGEEFTGGIKPVSSGTSSMKITYDAYGSGANPLLRGSEIESGWTNVSGTIYSKTVSGYTPGTTGAGLILEDGVPLKFREWNTDAATSLGADTGVYTYDPGDLSFAVLYVRCSSSAPSAHVMRATYYLFGIHGDSISNIYIKNIDFTEFSCHGITARSCTNINVMNCNAAKIGGAVLALSPVIYGGNGFEFTLNSSNCTVTDSTASEIFDSGFSPQVFESSTSTVNTSFINCTASKCGFAGIEISVLKYGTSSGESINGVVVRNCEVSDSGKGWSGVRYGNEGNGIRIKADTGAGTISGVVIEDSYIHDCENIGIYLGGECGTVSITRSKIEKCKVSGIECAGLAGVATLKLKLTSSLIVSNNITGTSHGISYNVVNGSGFEIINNTFYGNDLGMYIGDCGGQAVLKNNVFYAGTAHLYTASALASADFDYNCYYDFGSGIIAYNNIAYNSVADYSLAVSMDVNSKDANPQFVSAADLHLQSGSACLNAGTGAGVVLDFESQAFGSPPSMGAYR
ncbi:MAG: right-handed parallel beta-helix repeat-containing protein [Spirochaetes bacterium]|nr:right-handed parallel beta-helix repeat-containing protein [Spirochaetota bacterium]